MKRLLLSLGVAFLAGCGPAPLITETPVDVDAFRLPGGYAPEKARVILTQAAEVYASCGSYTDAGLVLTTFTNSAGDRIVERPFDTAFIRPDRFRYEFRDDGEQSQKYIVAKDGDLVQTWWYVNDQLTETDDLSLAVAGATGVSGGSAHTIPRLLMPETIDGFTLTQLVDVELLGEEEIDGVACYQIQGKHPQADWQLLWIENDRMLIRQIELQRQYQSFRTRSITTYEPQINIEINAEALAFEVP